MFLMMVWNALLLTLPVQNFDLVFHRLENSSVAFLALNRNAPWKPLLSRNVSLALWPLILAKANTWTKEHSHGPLDALFFLLREKNDVLFQNVRRRKIRKRKRYQMA